MRFLLISCLLLVGCGSYPKKQALHIIPNSSETLYNPYFSDESQDYIYKAAITVYKKNFGGLLIIKKVGEQNHRIAFTTEMGNKLFDFSFNNNTFKVNFIIDELDKKILVNILKNDFKALIYNPVEIKNTYQSNIDTIIETDINKKKHYYYLNKSQINKIVRANRGKENVRFHISNISDSIAQEIEIIHSNIQLRIKLKSLTK